MQHTEHKKTFFEHNNEALEFAFGTTICAIMGTLLSFVQWPLLSKYSEGFNSIIFGYCLAGLFAGIFMSLREKKLPSKLLLIFGSLIGSIGGICIVVFSLFSVGPFSIFLSGGFLGFSLSIVLKNIKKTLVLTMIGGLTSAISYFIAVLLTHGNFGALIIILNILLSFMISFAYWQIKNFKEVKESLKTKEERKRARAPFVYAGITGAISAFVTGCFLLYSYILTSESLNINNFSGILLYAIVGLTAGTYMATIQKNLKTKIIFIVCVVVGSVLPVIASIYHIIGDNSLIFFLSSGISGSILSLTLLDFRASVVLFFMGIGGLVIGGYLAFMVAASLTQSYMGSSWSQSLILISFNLFYSFFMSLIYFVLYQNHTSKQLTNKKSPHDEDSLESSN